MEKIEKLIFEKNKYNRRLIFMICLIIVFLLLYVTSYSLSMDEVWNYGFAYNVSQGLLPYRDFNMILTPLYLYQLTLLILIFGNTFKIYIIFNSIIAALVQYFLVKKYGMRSLLLIPCIAIVNYTGYNFYVLMLFIIFLNIKESKRSEIFKGLLIALMILTKQTIGGILLIFSFIKSKNKKKFLIGFIPLCILFLVYLFLTNSVYQFFDYCLFGMFEFTGGNVASHLDVALVFYVLMFPFLIYLNKKNKFKNDELLYFLLFQIMSAPIFDFIHISIALIPFLGYLLATKIANKKEYLIALSGTSFYIFISIFLLATMYINGGSVYHNSNSFLNGKRLNFDISCMHDIKEEINRNYIDYKVYHLYAFAYLYKLENKEVVTKFDLTNKGNMGYNGEEKYIQEIDAECNDKKCLLLIDNAITEGQISEKIKKHINSNYDFVRAYCSTDWYTNQKTDSLLEKIDK